MLVAIGIDWEGRRQVLGVEMANRESSTSWKEFLLGPKRRGLRGVFFAVSDESARRLFGIISKRKNLFLYGERVVEMTRSNEDKMPVLTPLEGQSFRSRIEHYGPVMAYRVGSHGELLLKPHAKCSLDTALALLASRERTVLPSIALIHNCPIFTREGVLGRGYHATCGGRLVKTGKMPQEMPLEEAVKLPLEVVAEFDFLEPSDKSRAIAAIVSPALKPGELLKTHFPLFVFEADESQAGKGFFLELVQSLYREFASFVTQRKGGVGSFDESLAQKLINGRLFIKCDNIRNAIDSQFLEAILTCPFGGTVQIRPDRFIFQLVDHAFRMAQEATELYFSQRQFAAKC